MASEDVCRIKENIARSENRAEMKRNCNRLQSYSSYLDKAGAIAVKLAKRLLKEGDVDVAARNVDPITAALANPALPDEFRHSVGGGVDD